MNMDHDNFRLDCSFNNFSLISENSTSFEASTHIEERVLGLSSLTGVIVALLLDLLLSVKYKRHNRLPLYVHPTKLFSNKVASRTLVFVLLVLILPLVIILLSLALLYKVLCSTIIMRKENFVGFLDSFDVFWSLEDDTSKSIINVLGVIESESSDDIVLKMKEKLQIMTSNENIQKIFYRRYEDYGFYYWKKYKKIDINQYVEILEINTTECFQESTLENLMTDVQDLSLPYEDKALFQILVTKQRINNIAGKKGDYGIIFRIHHSVGDGVALIELLCQIFVEENIVSPINMFSLPESNTEQGSPRNLLEMMQKLCEIPICFIDGIIRRPDVNSLHHPTLLGKKIFKWTASDENLLTMVREIKDNVNQLSFSGVLLAALSGGLRTFYSERMAPIPEDVAVILPVRFSNTQVENELNLNNNFSVTILDLPVKTHIQKIYEICRRCDLLRKSVDPLKNHYFLKLICSSLPHFILQSLLHSSQATMVFSNMPGPATLTFCGGNVLKSLVFFVPNKGTTGLGVTALCYGGVLRFAAMADTVLVSDPSHLALIMNGMIEEIYRLHHQYVAK